MAASQSFAGEGVHHRAAQEGEADGDEHQIEHGLLLVTGAMSCGGRKNSSGRGEAENINSI
jgi:hypothetical protein